MTMNLHRKPATSSSRQLNQHWTTTTADQQRRDNHQRKGQTPMMKSDCQKTGRHPDFKRQTSNNSDQKPTTNNPYDALADELVDDGVTFYQAGTTYERTPTNQRTTSTTDATNTTSTDFIGFHPKNISSISFDFQSKTKDKQRCPKENKALSPKKQLDKKHRLLYALLRFKMYETNQLLDTEAVQSEMSEAKVRTITTADWNALIREMQAPEFKGQIANGNLIKVMKQKLL